MSIYGHWTTCNLAIYTSVTDTGTALSDTWASFDPTQQGSHYRYTREEEHDRPKMKTRLTQFTSALIGFLLRRNSLRNTKSAMS